MNDQRDSCRQVHNDVGQRITSIIFPFSIPVLRRSFPRGLPNNMAKSKEKKKESESGEANDTTVDESRTEEPALDYDELVKRVCAIAKPLAGRKLTKRLYKTVKRG